MDDRLSHKTVPKGFGNEHICSLPVLPKLRLSVRLQLQEQITVYQRDQIAEHLLQNPQRPTQGRVARHDGHLSYQNYRFTLQMAK